MSRTPQQKSISLAELSRNKLVFTKVITMIDKQTSYDVILQYLESKDMKIAKGSLTNLKKKLEEARDTGVPIAELLDKRKKTGIKDLNKDKVIGYVGGEGGELRDFSASEAVPQNMDIMDTEDLESPMTVNQMQNKFYSIDTVLEEVIFKSLNTIKATDFLDVNIGLKAIDTYLKMHDVSKTGGLTINALKQYQILSDAKLKALVEIVLAYIPESQQDEALQEMERVEKEFIANIEVAPDGRDLLNALRKAGVDL